jgi:hypothetical protein
MDTEFDSEVPTVLWIPNTAHGFTMINDHYLQLRVLPVSLFVLR